MPAHWRIGSRRPEASPFVNDQAKESLNFQLTLLAFWLVALLARFTCLGGVFLVLVEVANVFCCLFAAMAARQGQAYRYPFCVRFIK